MKKNIYMVSLPDGSVVDISTKEGAYAVLEGVPNCFSSELKKIRKLRKEKRLNARGQKKELFWSISYLAKYIFRETFQAKIPELEIQDLMDFFVEEIKSFTEKRSWISTGRLHINDYEILLVCGDFLSNCHAVPVLLAFESDFFQVLTSFIKARKDHGGRALPHVSICTVVGAIVLCTFSTADCDFDNWSKEKIFKKFEASGILEQILRCSTVPRSQQWRKGCSFNMLLDGLRCCPSILTRKFKNGEPYGDTLKAILDGRDGSRHIQPKILNRLQGLARFVESMDLIEFKANLPFGKCLHCSKNGDVEAPLFCCGQCRIAHYCSRKCQKAAWKSHKSSCRKTTGVEKGKELSLMMFTRRFMDLNSETVFQAMDEKYRSSGVGPRELAVEVSFMPNESAIIPALHDPLTLKIVLVRDEISGQDRPEWLRGCEVSWALFQNKIKNLLAKGRFSSGALVIYPRLWMNFFWQSIAKLATRCCSLPVSGASANQNVPIECNRSFSRLQLL